MRKTATKTLPIRERIEAANTDLQNARGLKARLMAYSSTARAERVDVDEQFRDRLRNGADPDDLVNDYVDAKARQIAVDLFGSNVVASTLQHTVLPVSLEKSFVDTALDMCQDELDSIMARVDKHRDLIERHTTDARTAMAAGTADEYQTAEQILDDYDRLRAEYKRQIRLRDEGLTGTAIDSVHCRDFLDVDPHWLRRRSVTSILEEYPDPAILRWFRGLTVPIDRTRAETILAVADHQPWLPSADELRTIDNAADQLCRHNWHSGNVGRDRAHFANLTATIRNITHHEPLPQPGTTRRLA
ncbi:hypothetical protein SAMN04488550_1170 [Gordonia malaquae]|uniref:Uncharacterized protein n=1 Tax=Gordonia malaquae NBRC 108250 TaxID=1223542 RepID=M3UYZ1_GORML|nr:hypothetical protein [Gordonia malaquae]GAC81152.1 hypothetical protein GM1_029_00550 [Gordonia malaquae NBRC 108250]SEC01756.1 hypothetical protein SAMN04488550_1170 [Gordonia malaquae]